MVTFINHGSGAPDHLHPDHHRSHSCSCKGWFKWCVLLTTSLGFQLHMISTKMIILFITYKGPNNVRQTTLKEDACSHFLFSILLFGAGPNMALQFFWIFQTATWPQLYFLSVSCNFFTKNSTITPFTSPKTSFFSHRKHPKLCKNVRPGIRETLCECPHLFLHQQSKKLVSSPPSSHLFSYTNATTELSSPVCFPYPLPFPDTLYPDYGLRGAKVS